MDLRIENKTSDLPSATAKLDQLSTMISKLEENLKEFDQKHQGGIRNIMNRLERQEKRADELLKQQMRMIRTSPKVCTPDSDLKNPFLRPSNRDNFPGFDESLKLDAEHQERMLDLSDTLDGISLIEFTPAKVPSSEKKHKTISFLEQEKQEAEKFFDKKVINHLQTPAKYHERKVIMKNDGLGLQTPKSVTKNMRRLEGIEESPEENDELCMADMFEKMTEEQKACQDQPGENVLMDLTFNEESEEVKLGSLHDMSTDLSPRNSISPTNPGIIPSPIHRCGNSGENKKCQANHLKEREVQTEWTFPPRHLVSLQDNNAPKNAHSHLKTPSKADILGRPPKSPGISAFSGLDFRSPSYKPYSSKKAVFASPEMSPIIKKSYTSPQSNSSPMVTCSPQSKQYSPNLNEHLTTIIQEPSFLEDEEEHTVKSQTPKHVHFFEDKNREDTHSPIDQSEVSRTPQHTMKAEGSFQDRSSLHSVEYLEGLASPISSDKENMSNNFSLADYRHELSFVNKINFEEADSKYAYSKEKNKQNEDALSLNKPTKVDQNFTETQSANSRQAAVDRMEQEHWLGQRNEEKWTYRSSPLNTPPKNRISNFSTHLQEAVTVGVTDRDVQFEYAHAFTDFFGNQNPSSHPNKWTLFENRENESGYSFSSTAPKDHFLMTPGFGSEGSYSPLKIPSSMKSASKEWKRKLRTPTRASFVSV